MTPDELAYQDSLLHGGGVAIPLAVDEAFKPSLNALLDLIGRTSTPSGQVVRLGRFTTGDLDVLLVPNDPEVIRALAATTRMFAGDTSIGTRLQIRAQELEEMILGATGAGMPQSEPVETLVKAPCGGGVDVPRDEVDAALAAVSSPKVKRRPLPSDPLVVSYGLGVDSTAMLVGLAALFREGREEFRPEIILFADVGAEKDESYAYMGRMNRWLKSVGFPTVQVVAWATEHTAKGYGAARTLEQQCLINQTMPSISASKFGASLCSVLWKQDTMNRWMEIKSGLLEQRRGEGWVTKSGGKIVKAIGYDSDETKRAQKGTFRVDQELRSLKDKGRAPIYEYWYPLQAWGWDRARCIAEIETAVGAAPPKSSCWYCGAMKKHELLELPKEELMRALLIETVAARGRHGENQDFGLGGTFRWLDFAKENDLVTSADLARLERQVQVVLDAAPSGKGTEHIGAQERMARLPAFSELRGFRGKKLPIWDRYEAGSRA